MFKQLESAEAYKAFYDEQGKHYGNHHLTEDFPRVKFILERVKPTDVVLEMGCQTGGVTRLVAPKVNHVYANELSDTYRERAKEVLQGLDNITLIPGFAEGLGDWHVTSGKCDVVIAMELLEHVKDLNDLCWSVWKCLRVTDWEFMEKTGRALFSVPKGYTDALGEHVREFTEQSFRELLEYHFVEVEITDAGEWYLAEARP